MKKEIKLLTIILFTMMLTMGSTCSKNDDNNSGNDKSEIEIENVDDENMPLNEMTRSDDEENDEDESSNKDNENE